MKREHEILSQITVWAKYAKYRPELNRRETWEELVERNKQMHINKFPELAETIELAYTLVLDKKILPSMRSLQFGGRPIEVNNTRLFNCSYLTIDDYRAFNETMFLLLSGTGVGYSVQRHNIDKLPTIKKAEKSRRYLISDSIEGWADAVKVLVKSYFGLSSWKPSFDYRAIRAKGERLITSGGVAPGPEPLKICLTHIEAILDRKQDGDKLTSIDCHDILCHIADAVLSGGIRRSAMIALFDHDDEDMLTCKFGNWWEVNPQRGRANNSAVILRNGPVTKEMFLDLWKKVELSNSGEPGFYFSNDENMGTNPCCFTGDTLVATADGRNAVTIKQLCEENYRGPVYSMQTQINQVVTSHCSRVWKSRENAELVMVTLDDGSSFRCTPDHRIMLRDGQYVQAKDLKEGTSLMPFNSFKRSDRNYRMISSNSGRDIAQYAHVAQYYDLIKEGYEKQHIHHKDGNGLNDRIENLEVVNASEHIKEHMKGRNNAFYKMSEETKKVWIEKQSVRQKGENNTNSNGLTTEEMIMRCFDRTVQKRAKLSYREVLDSCGVKFLSKGRLKEMKAETVGEFAKKLAELANHKVISVEYLSEREDVYDMTVEGTHNFAVITSSKDEEFITSSGVFVHNCEIALQPFQFCNLVEVNASDIEDQQDLNNRVHWASVIGTLQASYTDFHYLRSIWKKTTEKEALLGIGMTGIASGAIDKLNLEEAAQYAVATNIIMAKRIGINPAARVTCVKPSGTSSLVLGTSSGVHAWHDKYYIRRMRVGKNEAIYTYLSIYHPELIEDDVMKPQSQAVVSIPVAAPEGAITRSDETAIQFLERVKNLHNKWIKPGHVSGNNTHNVSATVTIKQDEWKEVGEWLWENQDHYNGLSFLPEDLGSYQQTPFETITKEQYVKLVENLQGLDVTKIVEVSDNTNLSDQAACAGGACEII